MSGWRLLSIVVLFASPVLVVRVWLLVFTAISERETANAAWIGVLAASVVAVALGLLFYRLGVRTFSGAAS